MKHLFPLAVMIFPATAGAWSRVSSERRKLLLAITTKIKARRSEETSLPKALAWAMTIFAAMAPATDLRAGIPEPDLVWYGRVSGTSGGAPVRLTRGVLVWLIEPVGGGPTLTVRTNLANINDQFSFIVRVPCETPEPGAGPNPATLNLSQPASSYRRVTVTLDGQPLFLAGGAAEFTLRPADRGKVERIDLRSTSAPADADNDGLADSWEQQFFGAAGANPNADNDADGLSNLREYRAGTDPTDPRSVLEFVEISASAGRVSVKWSSQPGKTYRVRRAASLLTNAADYAVVQSGIAASPPANEFIDASAGNAAQFFYLIEAEE